MRGWIASAALAFAVPAQAATVSSPSLRTRIEALQAVDARVQSIGWQLVRGNAAYCREVAPRIGLVLFDAAAYADPAAVRAALELTSDIAVEAVAVDSPAARAGLRAGQALRTVAGQTATDLPEVGPNDYARLVGLHDRVDAMLATTGRVAFANTADGEIAVVGEPACVTRFELLGSGTRAAADGKRVVIGRKLVEVLPPDPFRGDELLAAALAHELAHNLLGHRVRLAREGRTWGNIKITEREADRLSVWLLANAGYDPRAAARFFERWGPTFDLGLFATPDHDGWKGRAKLAAAEVAKVEAARGSDGNADWRAVFPLIAG